MKHISVGLSDHSTWGVDTKGRAYYRVGQSDMKPQGKGWKIQGT